MTKLAETIWKSGCLEAGDSVVVGFSGGADSLALLAGLMELAPRKGLSVTACHVHHGIRGEEADRDAEASEQMARRLGASFCLMKVDAPSYAKARGIGLEEAARVLRYDAFSNVARNIKAVDVACPAKEANLSREAELTCAAEDAAANHLHNAEPACAAEDAAANHLHNAEPACITENTEAEYSPHDAKPVNTANGKRTVKVATAHTKSDYAETVLMRILRGTGPDGLAAMSVISEWPFAGSVCAEYGKGKYAESMSDGFGKEKCTGIAPAENGKRNGSVLSGEEISAASREMEPELLLIRPLLAVTAEETRSFCDALGMIPRKDSTNNDTAYLRNRVRLELLPQLKTEYNPAIEDALVRLGTLAGEARSLLDDMTERAFQNVLSDCKDAEDTEHAKCMRAADDAERMKCMKAADDAERMKCMKAADDAADIKRVECAANKMRQTGESGISEPFVCFDRRKLLALSPALAKRVLTKGLREIGMEKDLSQVTLDSAYRLLATGKGAGEAEFAGNYRMKLAHTDVFLYRVE